MEKDRNAAKEATPLAVWPEESRRLFMYDGVPMVEAVLCFPRFAQEQADALYLQAKEKCLQYAEEVLLPLSRQKYEEEEGTRRRFLHRRLVYRHALTLSVFGEFLSLRREATLSYRGRVLQRQVMGEVLDGQGHFCIPRMFPGWKELVLQEKEYAKCKNGTLTVTGFLLDKAGQLQAPLMPAQKVTAVRGNGSKKE